jgi:hypothetical protein
MSSPSARPPGISGCSRAGRPAGRPEGRRPGSARGVTPSPELDHPQAAAALCSAATPLVRFGAPSAHEGDGIHQPRACLTRFVPPSGFLTLLTVCSPITRPALFHAGGAHGISPLQSLSLQSKSLHLSVHATLMTSAPCLTSGLLRGHECFFRGVRIRNAPV